MVVNFTLGSGSAVARMLNVCQWAYSRANYNYIQQHNIVSKQLRDTNYKHCFNAFKVWSGSAYNLLEYSSNEWFSANCQPCHEFSRTRVVTWIIVIGCAVAAFVHYQVLLKDDGSPRVLWGGHKNSTRDAHCRARALPGRMRSRPQNLIDSNNICLNYKILSAIIYRNETLAISEYLNVVVDSVYEKLP